MKTDLKKILSISGEQGLYLYVNQAAAGIVAESLMTGNRKCFGLRARISSLADIAVYTEDDEVRLQTVLEKMRDYLSGGEAPSSKAGADQIKALFEAVLPDYDRDRFYVSHMKKVVDWYNLLRNTTGLDFESDDENEADGTETEA